MTDTVILVGPPASGKTTVGTLLADRLRADFRDSDLEIESRMGKKITDIFAQDGEAKFRQIEAETIKDLVTKPGVLALGGGAVTSPEVREILKGRNVVWLKVDSSAATCRVGSNTDRPLLAGDVNGKLANLIKEREPFYREVAKFSVDTAKRTPEQVVDLVIQMIDWAKDCNV